MDEDGGDHHGNGIRHQLCGNHAVKSEKAIQEKQERNVDKTLSADGKKQGFGALAHCLKSKGGGDIIKHQGRSQTADSQKRNAEGNGCRIADEEVHDRSGKELEE